jgi:Putative  PD-(D/E)XK family member, (DUF4420)
MPLKLHELFRGLEKPPRETDGSLQVSTTRVTGSTHRIGKDADGSPVILLGVESDSAPRPPDIRLENLAVLHDVSCRIWSTEARFTAGKFTVVRCNSSVEDVRQYFLHVMDPFLAMLGRKPTPRLVSQMVDHLVEVFRALSLPPRGTVQGLWAELLLIALSNDPVIALGAWHSVPEETFDFALGGERVDVKSCSGTQRRHTFSLEQLQFADSTVGVIASVLTQRASGGTSVAELADRIRERVASHPGLMLRVDKAVALTLGDSSLVGLEQRFNEDYARDSLAFVDAGKIPRPGEIPSEVARVRFEVDITRLSHMKNRRLSQSNGLLRALVPKAVH